ncbi:MAG: hypothetical protein KKG00_01140 [Bacteroidetes bacterium]|nr:hypothetical protein [Bacteroidota bacterium]
MKTLVCSIIFLFSVQYTHAQKIDENGRTIRDRAAQNINIQPASPMLQQLKVDKGSQEIVVEFAFPATVSSGEMRLFHPREDKELAVFILVAPLGQVRIPTASLISGMGIVGLYKDGKLLNSLKVKSE